MTADKKRLRELRILAVELSAGRKIARKLQRILWREMPGFGIAGFEFVVAYVLFLRVERTFSSTRTLARTQMVDDAMALVRVMVEKVINAEYIFLAGTETALDYIQYHSFRVWRDLEDLRSVSPELLPDYALDIWKKLEKAHDEAKLKILPDGSTRSRFGRGHDWIDIGLPKRAEFIDETLKSRFSMRESRSARVLYQTAYKKSAGYLHGTWISVARSLQSEDGDDSVDENGMATLTLRVRIKDKDPGVAGEAMNIANLTVMAIILFVGKMFARQSYLDWATSFTASYKKDLRSARNEI